MVLEKVKLEKYGSDFINAIIEFHKNKSVKKEKRKYIR
jgi:ATP-dependent DNA helicase RecQ